MVDNLNDTVAGRMVEETMKSVGLDVLSKMADAIGELRWKVEETPFGPDQGTVGIIEFGEVGLRVALTSAQKPKPIELIIGLPGAPAKVSLSIAELGVFVEICKRMVQLAVAHEALWQTIIQQPIPGGKGNA